MDTTFLGPGFVPIAILWSLFIATMWLIIGWRAMKAHEKLARAAEEYTKWGSKL